MDEPSLRGAPYTGPTTLQGGITPTPFGRETTPGLSRGPFASAAPWGASHPNVASLGPHRPRSPGRRHYADPRKGSERIAVDDGDPPLIPVPRAGLCLRRTVSSSSGECRRPPDPLGQPRPLDSTHSSISPRTCKASSMSWMRQPGTKKVAMRPNTYRPSGGHELPTLSTISWKAGTNQPCTKLCMLSGATKSLQSRRY